MPCSKLSPTTTAEKSSAWLLCAEVLLLIKIVTPKACNDSLDAAKRCRVNVRSGPRLRGITERSMSHFP